MLVKLPPGSLQVLTAEDQRFGAVAVIAAVHDAVDDDDDAECDEGNDDVLSCSDDPDDLGQSK